MITKFTNQTNAQIIIILFAMLWLSACSSSEHTSKVSRRSSNAPHAADANQEPFSAPSPDDSVENDPPPPSPTPPEVPLRDLPTSFALRGFDQLNATMASLTGVSALPTNLVPAPIQDGLKTMLPGENHVTNFQGGSQFATYKLAAEYCNIMVDNEAAKPTVLTNIDLKKPPKEVFSEAGKTAVAKAFTGKFWVLPPANLAQAQGLLTDLITELMAGKTLTTSAQTTAIVKAVCTATLASAPVSFY